MRKRLNYANVTATLALFFAMSGGALAAKHYLLNSTKQISPKVLKALKGNAGPKGTTGATGASGAAGKEGSQGKEGKAGKEGKEGTPATDLWAVVSSTAKIERGSGAVNAESFGTGFFVVKFNQNITQCAFLATVGTVGFSGTEPGDIDVAGAAGTTDSVFLETRSNGGTLENRSFHLAVFC